MIQPRPPHLSPETIEHLRAQLIEERVRLRELADRLADSASRNSPENLGDTTAKTHLADLGTEAFGQASDLGLAEQAGRRVSEIDGALDRMERGTFGICETCGGGIAPERLEALPSASRCAACQWKAEQDAGHD